MPTTMPSVVPHPMQLSNLATAVRMRSQEGSSPLSSPIQKPAPNRKPRKKRVDLHGKLEAMSDEPLADLLRAQTQPWTPEEDHLIVQMVEQVGHKWSAIATLLPGRTDNGVRNRWNRLDRCEHTHGTPHSLTSQQPSPTGQPPLSRVHASTPPHSHPQCQPRMPSFDSPSLDTSHTSRLTPSRRLKHLMHVSPRTCTTPRLTPACTPCDRAQREKQKDTTDGEDSLSYRCRRCGLPKRGHTCLALTSEPPLLPPLLPHVTEALHGSIEQQFELFDEVRGPASRPNCCFEASHNTHPNLTLPSP